MRTLEIGSMAEVHGSQFETNACDQCFRTKVTCSRHTPQCQRCQKSSTPCTYSFGKFMGKPKRKLKNRQLQQGEWKTDKETTTKKSAESCSDIGGCQYSGNTQQHQRSEVITETRLGLDAATNNTLSTSDTSVRPALISSNSEGSRKRSLNLFACDQCYRFKVKCVRDGDFCQRCTGNKNICTYSIDNVREKEDDIDLQISTSPTKRRRHSLGKEQTSDKKIAEEQQPGGNVYETEWIGTKELSNIPFDVNRINGGGSGHMLSKEMPMYLHTNGDYGQEDQNFPIPLDSDDKSYEFLNQLAMLGQETPLWTPITDHNPNLETLQVSHETSAQEPEIPESSSQRLNLSNSNSDSMGSLFDKECYISSALSTLSKLHELGRPSIGTNKPMGLDSLLSLAHYSLFICEQVGDSKSCPPYAIVMLCISILHQLLNCFNMLSSGIRESHSSISMSIKIGDVAFYDMSYAPSIMQAILSGENKRAKRACERLINVCTRDGDFCEKGTEGDPGLASEYNCLIKLLDIVKHKFTT